MTSSDSDYKKRFLKDTKGRDTGEFADIYKEANLDLHI